MSTKSLFFGKYKWGQDLTQIFITIYTPDVAFETFSVRVTNTSLSFSAPKPEKESGYGDLEVEFREDVVGQNATWKSSTWKLGSKKNAITFTIPKLHPHLFDRLQTAKVTKALKKRMEIDWNRWKVDDGAEEDEDEEDEDEEDDDEQVHKEPLILDIKVP